MALQTGYVKPEFVEEDQVEIVDGRHPMIEQLRSDPFVPSSVALGNVRVLSYRLSAPIRDSFLMIRGSPGRT